MQFQLGVRTSNVTSAQALFEIITNGKDCYVRNLRITLATGVTGVFGLGRPAAAGITPTTPLPFLGLGGGESTSPTSPTAFFERVTVPATVGFVVPVLSPFNPGTGRGGIKIPVGGTLVLFNITGGPTLDVSFDIDE
jgi:hypothetical protein